MWKLLAMTSKSKERIPWHFMELLTILFFIIGSYRVETATVSAGDDKPGRLGDGHNVSITCTYTLNPDETADTMAIHRRKVTEGSFNSIASFNIPAGRSSYVDQELKSRAVLIMSDGSATIQFNEIQCDDAATYKCIFGYNKNQVLSSIDSSMVLTVEAEPKNKPTFNEGNPNEGPFTEDETLQLKCGGNVGLPAGNLLWFGYKDDEILDLTSQATEASPVESATGSEYCTFTRESTLKLNMTRAYNGFVFRCSVNQSLHIASSDQTCVDTSCVQTQQVVVHYPVRQSDLSISSNPDGNIIVGSGVTLKCTVDGNPTPTFRWFKDGNENRTSVGSEWKLDSLQLGDTGVYSCHGSNVVNGTMYNVTKSVNINVVETTTPAPTTTAVTKTSPPEGGKTDAVRPSPNGDDDNTTTIIIAVCVVIGILFIIAIIIAIFIIKKKRKQSEVEEPPEKPFSKNNLTMYNAKPDLVTDEKKQNISYKNDDGLTYADLKFDDRPRSRRPVALADNMTDYADITIPQV